ncbi:hypothetical protein [Comamonas testosteroni]|uniref:hypothetical protein n=1 Tax=Comamonas testosteroni TaxID=285 RepID=UPI0012D2A972|nr:hypothetical protein [Comamonas testosteroni]
MLRVQVCQPGFAGASIPEGAPKALGAASADQGLLSEWPQAMGKKKARNAGQSSIQICKLLMPSVALFDFLGHVHGYKPTTSTACR